MGVQLGSEQKLKCLFYKKKTKYKTCKLTKLTDVRRISLTIYNVHSGV